MKREPQIDVAPRKFQVRPPTQTLASPAVQFERKFPPRLGQAGEADLFVPEDVETNQPKDARSLAVAIVGPANAGKSSLMNRLVGSKVSIVSDLAQTTREEIKGVVTFSNVQLTFSDTPGIIPPKHSTKRPKELMQEAWETIDFTQDIMVVIDSFYRKMSVVDYLIESLRKLKDRQLERIEAQKKDPKIDPRNVDRPRGFVLVLNKMDLVTRLEMESLMARFKALEIFDEMFPVSALNGTGIDALKNYYLKRSEKEDWEYPSATSAVVSNVQMAEEVIREKLFLYLRKEVPYLIRQENFAWTHVQNRIRIDQILYVAKESQRQMVVGKGGSLIRRITDEATRDLTSFFKRDVQLGLNVKVDKSKVNVLP